MPRIEPEPARARSLRVVSAAGFFTVLASFVVPVVVQAAPCGLTDGDHTRTFRFEDIDRPYDVRVPSGCDSAEPLALVFDFHEQGIDRAAHAAASGFRALADARRAVVVTPQGHDEPDGTGAGWNAFEGQFGTSERDDLGFVRALTSELQSLLPIDGARIYATGHGHGGAFSHRLGCRASDLFAAVAPVAYSAYGSGAVQCPATGIPVGMIQFHGLDDAVVPYDGLLIPQALFGILSAPESALLWQELNACQNAPVTIPAEGTAVCERADGCDGDVEVELCTLDDDHDLYDNPDGVDIAARAYDFFARHAPEPASGLAQAAALLVVAVLGRRRSRGAGRPE